MLALKKIPQHGYWNLLGWISILLIMGIFSAMLPRIAQAQQDRATQQAPEAGGPEGEIGPYSVPRTKKPEPPPEPVQPPKNPPEIGIPTITKDVGLVNVDVLVTTKDGQFIPNLAKDNFRVLEDGVPQQISSFNIAETPITAVLLVEFSNNLYPFMVDALNASYAFAQQLKPEDWIAVIAYDMKPHILTDFTQNKQEVYAALSQLRVPGFSDTNLFDALYDTLDRMEGVEGRKYIILVSSGRDTFSRLNYDKVMKKIQAAHNVTIFAISTGRAFREWVQAHYGGNPGVNMAMMNYLQADNEMNTFAKLSGGRAYFPLFQAEFPEIFRDIGSSVRHEYNLAYHPSNTKLDGTYRKLKVELVDPSNGHPLKVVDQKGKPVKYNIVAREGYTAKHVVD